MVRVYVYDRDVECGQIPCEIIEYGNEVPFAGRNFHQLTRCYSALYEGMKVVLVFECDGKPFVKVVFTFESNKFKRTFIDVRGCRHSEVKGV